MSGHCQTAVWNQGWITIGKPSVWATVFFSIFNNSRKNNGQAFSGTFCSKAIQMLQNLLMCKVITCGQVLTVLSAQKNQEQKL